MWTLASARRYWSNVFCIATGIIMTPCYTSTWLYIRYNYYAIGLHAIPGLVDRRPSQPASGISASHTNPHKMLLHWMHFPDTLRIYTHSLDGTVLLMVWDRYGIAPGISMAQTHKNIVARCYFLPMQVATPVLSCFFFSLFLSLLVAVTLTDPLGLCTDIQHSLTSGTIVIRLGPVLDFPL